MIYGYARVSSRSQADGFGLDVQRQLLTDAGAQYVYEDVFTGTTMDRPSWDELNARLAEGDTLVVAKLDRIARTAVEGCQAVRNLVDKGITVNVLNMGTISNTPVGKMLLTVMFAMAEFERDMIVERTQAGKAIARQNANWHEGRPRHKDPKGLNGAIKQVQLGEMSAYAAAKLLGMSQTTFRRRLKEVQHD